MLRDASPAVAGAAPEELLRGVQDEAATLFRLAAWARGDGSSPPPRVLVLAPSAHPRSERAADAGAAFLKSWTLEQPQLRAKWVSVPADWAPARCGLVVCAELTRGGPRIRCAHDDAGRWGDSAEPLALAPPPLALRPGDVSRVVGGARGITRRLAATLAHETGATLALAGSSPPDDPAVRGGIDALSQLGVVARYFRCDVTDREQVARVIDAVERELGPIAALLYGAGVTRFAALSEARFEDHLRCVRTKAVGLTHVLAHASPARLKALHVISSVLGRTGMARQADYAFANAWLDGAVAELSAAYPHLHALSLAYTVWAETGMGARLGALEGLRGLGVAALDDAQGEALYRVLLRGRPASSCVALTGRLVPALERRLFDVPRPAESLARSRFFERPLRWIPGSEVVAEFTLTRERDPYIADHVFEGTPMFPAVMGIEAMSAAAQACAMRSDVPTFLDVHLRAPIVVPADGAVRVRVHAQRDPAGHARFRAALRAETDGFTQDCFSAVCEFDAPDAPAPAPLEPFGPPLPIDPQQLTPHPLFQGAFFRRITAIFQLEPGQLCVAEVAPERGAVYFSLAGAAAPRTPHPAARDAFFQTILLASRGRGLPVTVRELRRHLPLTESERLLCRARLVAHEGDAQRWDVDVFSPDGAPVESLLGVTVRAPSPPRSASPTRGGD